MRYFHPITAFAYFLAVIIITAIIQNPFFIGTSLLCSAVAAVTAKGIAALKTAAYILPLCAFSIIINLLFSNAGVTALFFLPNGNAVTAESLIFAAMPSLMMLALMMWFISFNNVMTTDKTVYLFGRALPSFGLLISMTMKFIPQFAARLRQTAEAQSFVGNDIKNGRLKSRLKSALNILSISITGAIEGAAITAQSMKNRGYGTARRTSYSIYRFTARDAAVLCITVLLAAAVCVLCFTGNISYSYYPFFSVSIDGISAAGYLCWLLLCAVPVIISAWEEIKWNCLS